MSATRDPFAGILAAGQGTRFLASGESRPKALVPVAGRALISRALDAFFEAGFAAVTVVVNDAVAPAVTAHLAKTTSSSTNVELVQKTTGSTLETFEVLVERALASGKQSFVFTTVDAITAPGELLRFARASRAETLALGIAPVELGDEGPLRVSLDEKGRATLGQGPFATSGFYAGKTAAIAPRVRAARARGVPSLRAFLTDEAGASVVRGIVLARAVDVDTPADVVAAERVLAAGPGGPARPPTSLAASESKR